MPEVPLRSLPPPQGGDSEYLRERAKINKLLAKHQIELEDDTKKLVDHIVEQAIIAKGMEKLLTKDWFISEAIQLYHAKFNNNRQRTLEWLAELTGVYVRNERGVGPTVADVVIESLNTR